MAELWLWLLGRTGLEVLALGASGNYGLGPADVVRAYHELGVRYFHVAASIAPGIRELVEQGHRDRLVIGAGTMASGARAIRDAWAAEAQALRVDVIDVWHLYFVRTRFGVRAGVWEEMRRLKQEGRVRALAISCHDRRLARRLADELDLDALMIRYNAAHRGAEQDIFETLPPSPARPGVVAYTATRWGRLLRPAGGLPGMTAPECYRFALSHPQVDVVLCGAGSYAELRDAALGVAAGPLPPERMAEVHRLGDAVRGGLT